MEAIAELRARRGGQPLWLVLHYLPSSLDQNTPERVLSYEATALRLVDGVLTTSELMGQFAAQRGARRVCTVEPGVEPGPLSTAPAGKPAAFIMLANVTSNKGLLPLLEALALRVGADERFTLSVVGDLAREPSYARRCQELCRRSKALRDRVRLVGARSPDQARALLARSDVFVSASVFEAYGMALAEARAAGVPILARAGGNVAYHVDVEWGGQLCDNHDALADGILALLRAPGELAMRQRRARAHRFARSWETAVDEFLAVAD